MVEFDFFPCVLVQVPTQYLQSKASLIYYCYHQENVKGEYPKNLPLGQWSLHNHCKKQPFYLIWHPIKPYPYPGHFSDFSCLNKLNNWSIVLYKFGLTPIILPNFMVGLLLVVHLDHHALALDFVLLEVDIHTKYRGMKFWYLLQYSAYKKKKYLSHSFIQWFIDAVASVIIFFQQISQDKRLNFASVRLKSHSIAVHTDV